LFGVSNKASSAPSLATIHTRPHQVEWRKFALMIFEEIWGAEAYISAKAFTPKA